MKIINFFESELNPHPHAYPFKYAYLFCLQDSLTVIKCGYELIFKEIKQKYVVYWETK